MQMVRVSVQLPKTLKAKIDALRAQGTSASWFIRKLVEKHFEQARRKPAA
jgi:metal-responsive CopG/Arc/MetJ family transcriptional regulator